MDAISLLFCNVKRRHIDELPIWMFMACFAQVLIYVQQREILLVLWIAMLLGWCLRESATRYAKQVRSECNYVTAVALLVATEKRCEAKGSRLRGSACLAHVWRYTCEVSQATLAQIGLTHHCLTPRLLPTPA